MAAKAVRVIGPGRAGLSVARGLEKAGWRVADVVGRDAGPALAAAAAGVDLVIIATPDDAIAGVASAIEAVEGCVVAHLAGALGLDVLAPHRRRASIHPLRSLATTSADLDGAWFAVAGDPLAREVVADFGGHLVNVDDGVRAAYHAAAVMASNHLVALLGAVERVAARAGVPLDAFVDLARGTVDNVAALGPTAALTGPVARGDLDTVARHLAAIPPAERSTYEALSAAALVLATVAGGADASDVPPALVVEVAPA